MERIEANGRPEMPPGARDAAPAQAGTDPIVCSRLPSPGAGPFPFRREQFQPQLFGANEECTFGLASQTGRVALLSQSAELRLPVRLRCGNALRGESCAVNI